MNEAVGRQEARTGKSKQQKEHGAKIMIKFEYVPSQNHQRCEGEEEDNNNRRLNQTEIE